MIHKQFTIERIVCKILKKNSTNETIFTISNTLDTVHTTMIILQFVAEATENIGIKRALAVRHWYVICPPYGSFLNSTKPTKFSVPKKKWKTVFVNMWKTWFRIQTFDLNPLHFNRHTNTWNQYRFLLKS